MNEISGSPNESFMHFPVSVNEFDHLCTTGPSDRFFPAKLSVYTRFISSFPSEKIKERVFMIFPYYSNNADYNSQSIEA